MKKHFILKSVLAVAGLAAMLSANAAVFLKSTSMSPQTCDTSKDWCIDVRSDNSIKPLTTWVNGQGAAVTNSGSLPLSFGSDLENNSNNPFWDGIWLTQASITKHQVKSMKFNLVSVVTKDVLYPLSNCSVQRTFNHYKLGAAGVTHMVISKTAPGVYQCHIKQ